MVDITKQKEVLKAYLNYLKNHNDNPSYIPTRDEETAKYNVTNDPFYKELLSALQNEKDYIKQVEIVTDFITKQELTSSNNNKDVIVPDIPVNNTETDTKIDEIKQNKSLSLSYTNQDIGNRGFVNLLFASIILMVLAFIIFFVF